ncbi:MAG: PilT protein domain protein [Flavipsychrobacter sp.]|jgi:tRNA(fMet)-specific endonuclease VapC|nr:PilT protein domain protein [Flavipsychrobacter sp.]
MKKTGNKILLDTNIIIELFNGNKAIADKINLLSEFSICAIVLGELYIGINRVANKQKHLKTLNDFLQLCTVLEVDSVTAMHYGEIVATLYKKGKPVPVNDIWIAACAKQHGYMIVTHDKHFKEIHGITIKHW